MEVRNLGINPRVDDSPALTGAEQIDLCRLGKVYFLHVNSLFPSLGGQILSCHWQGLSSNSTIVPSWSPCSSPSWFPVGSHNLVSFILLDPISCYSNYLIPANSPIGILRRFMIIVLFWNTSRPPHRVEKRRTNLLILTEICCSADNKIKKAILYSPLPQVSKLVGGRWRGN